MQIRRASVSWIIPFRVNFSSWITPPKMPENKTPRMWDNTQIKLQTPLFDKNCWGFYGAFWSQMCKRIRDGYVFKNNKIQRSKVMRKNLRNVQEVLEQKTGNLLRNKN